MVDAIRLRKVIEKVTAMPDDWDDFLAGTDIWDQGDWIVGAPRDGALGASGDRDVRTAMMITDRGVIHDGKPCSTACCAAGQACVDYAPEGTVINGSRAVLPDREEMSVPTLARRLLGLTTSMTRDHRRDLFEGFNSREDLIRISEQLIAEQGE
jgi:hypothetical protein